MFSLKLKTKNGNDIKRKQSVTIFFKMNFKRGLKNKAEYTYRIMYGKKVKDSMGVLSLKDSDNIQSFEDLTLKVMLNLCHILAHLSKLENFDPDFVLFISPDFNYHINKSWKYIIDVFKRPSLDKINPDNDYSSWMKIFDYDYNKTWTIEMCSKLSIKKEELDMLKDFSDRNSNTKFMCIDPHRDKEKYAKSIHICDSLAERITEF